MPEVGGKFAHLSRLHVEGKKAWYELPEVKAGAAIEGVLANDANTAFLNARLKARRARRTMTPEAMAADRTTDRELFAKHVLTGWRGIADAAGAEVAFSHDEALLFLTALPDWLFDRLRLFFLTPENFVEPAPETAKERAGN